MEARRLSRILWILAGAALAACSGREENTPDPVVVKDNPITISMVTDSVSLATGDTVYFEFQVTPYDADFKHDVGAADCAVRMHTEAGSGDNWELVKIEPAPAYAGPGRYRAFVADKCLRTVYDGRLSFSLTDRYGRSSRTGPAAIHCETNQQVEDLLATGLTLVVVETVGGEEPTCEYVAHPPGCNGAGTKNATKVPGRVTVYNGDRVLYHSGGYLKDERGMTIKIRGNTSAYGAKKPFKFKLQKKGDMLGRGNDAKYKDKEWTLLRYDNMRTMVGFKVNELIGQQWTPAYRTVNLVVNGYYRGLYMLTEAVKRNTDCRLNVDKTGYVIEYDAYWWNEEVYFTNGWNYSMAYTFKYPDDEDVTDEQISYITRFIGEVEGRIRNAGAYEQVIDVPSFAGWLLACDILGNLDCAGSNLFLTKFDNTDKSKLMMANLWDFDSIYQMNGNWSNVHNYGAFYYPRLLSNRNTAFKKEYLARWDAVAPTIFDQVISFVDTFAASEEAAALQASIPLDKKRWGSSLHSIRTNVNTAKNWFSSRKPWLESAMNSLR